VRFVMPEENSEVKGHEVSVRVALVAPLPVAKHYVWLNGRPIPVDVGAVASDAAERGRILDKGRILEKGQEREAIARELPRAVARLVRAPQYARFEELRFSVPVEDTDGEYLRIAVAAETIGGSISDRRILKLRRPQAEANRGALRVLAIGVGAY